MAAPAGLSSGSAPEPGTEPAADPGVTVPRPAEPVLTAEPVLEAAEEPVLAAEEPVLAAEEPVLAAEPAVTGAEQAEAGRGESAADGLDPDLEPAQPAGPAGRRRGIRLLALAVLIGILALAGAAAAVLAVVTHGFRPKTVVTYRPAAVFSLRAGECINSSPNGLSVTVRSCATPHDAEVFATFRLAGSSWPGSASIRQEASDGCVSRVGAYLNPQLAGAGLNQEYVFPDQKAWQAGVRTIVCEVRPSSGQLTGSVRQPG